MSGVSGTKEWSSSSENFQVGCEHGCLYCYARASMLRFGRIRDATDWGTPVLNQKKLRRKAFGFREGVVMIPTTHDLTPRNIDVAIPYICKLLKAGNKLLIVSKPHFDCVIKMGVAFEEYKNQILFRFTIGSTNDTVLKFFEPGAPSFQERFEALKWAHSHEFATSVSSEPYFDATIIDLVPMLAPYITDAHWLGLLRKPELRIDTRKWGPKEWAMLESVKSVQDSESVHMLYNTFKDNDKVKWKDSIKKVIGLPAPEEAGLDI